ncbi:hypothetical protein CR513_12601, partial [Mucuna pruriens]
MVRTEKQGNEGAQERLQFLEDQLRAIEGIEKYNFKASDLCLVSDSCDVAYNYNLNLEKGQIKTWADLVEAFL